MTKGEDPKDPGSYFIINGTEKALITIEDLGANRFLVDKDTTDKGLTIGKTFSEYGSFS